MIDCTITAVSQEMNLEQNVTLTYLVLRLANGSVLRAAVDESTAASVIALHTQANGMPVSSLRPVVQKPVAPPPPAKEESAPPPPVDLEEREMPSDSNETEGVYV